MTQYTEGNPLLQLEGVGVSYGTKKIIENISFTIVDTKREGVNQGQTVAIVGRSGRGKSTLFKAMTGLISLTSGNIKIYTGKEVLTTLQEGEVGFVQQKYPLSRNQSVNSMLVQAAKQGGVPAKNIQSLVNQKLEEWNLVNQKSLCAKQLSGGQQQRVAILEQMLCSKHFIVLDEPFSGLDVKNKLDVKSAFQKISDCDDLNTIIFSTHEIELAVELADYIIVMGYQREANNSLIEIASVLQTFDMKALGLAWQPYSPAHANIQQQIESIMVQS